MGFTVRPGADDQRRRKDSALGGQGRVLLVIKDPGELDALAEGLASHFSFDVIPLSTVEGARMELVCRTYEVVVVEGAFGLSWLNELNPQLGVVVLGTPKKGALRDNWVVVTQWPGSVAELAQAIEAAIEGGAQPLTSG